ncbi:phytoene/squalene synthase family protein [Halorhodospira neutriphila]|uniref:Phytoene synthase n=1 Tax=Halorhodospira neutriphila TaxID=168379 RepID=A0ABS1E8T2_9GAMM|nr:phytoene/squalene synthase family protein [Halorhodospira neutriphila]MBK1727527.1 phytoene synthase [Halorhodospira neutriphila]
MRVPSPDPDLAPEPYLLSTDRTACRASLCTGSRTFLAASWLLPRSARDPATALYAFCRLADDAVDESGEEAQDAALEALYRRLERVYAGCPERDPADRAFSCVVHQFRIPAELPAALIEGFAWDAAGRRYETLDDLYAYAVRVAGTVGVMMALLMGVRSPGPLARACDLGVAMQLTNIARDVGEDARQGRLYLPRQWLREAGLDPDAFLAAPRFTPELAGVIQRLLHYADTLYERSMAGFPALPARVRPGICAARLLYAEIGRELERRGLDAVNQRAVVSGRRKARVLSGVAATLARAPRDCSAPPLAQAEFLIEAVEASAAAASPGPIEGRVAWVLELFDRLEQRSAAARSG